ncbi:hypothetical protein BCR34DRAFT_607508 [Clohesyomyces aquaticus]|uniref:Galactosyl transferase GMA12/MNN10 family-domain-containing protein n=1 Tax=Clohesyomyces aquaticus TaxID=1231657 RepID=A0A1Y1YGH4_9PLEO|nr:hypothetical protein BCR34DRAFT_607508 [Clohesyomyces aquaticus]
MGYDRYGVLASQHIRPQQQRSRFHAPTTGRLIRYVLAVILVLGFYTIWCRPGISPTTDHSLAITDVPLPNLAGDAHTVVYADNPSIQPDHVEESTAEIAKVESQGRETIKPETAVSVNPISYSGARFGKITASFGDPDPPYEDAIQSHQAHNDLHGYPHFILREHMIRGLWSKHGWIMTIIGQELAKPEGERLQWLLWHDRDTVLMNPQIPLDIFLPPEPQFSNIHLLVTNDRHGLNNGVFLIRVSQWAFKLFASALSIREYQPEIPLKYTEQSAMEEAIKRPWWAKSVVQVPQRWFNCYPPDGSSGDEHAPRICREGSMLIHFASNRDGKRPERMARFHEIADNKTAEWYKPVNETGYVKEIAEYWERLGQGEDQQSIVNDLGKRSWKVKAKGKKRGHKKRA